MGEIPRTQDRGSPIRRLGCTAEPIHTVSAYSPEIYGFNDDGFRGWWHAYFAYRSAPMGAVSAPAVAAMFYNYAPRMVERAVPGCWDIMAPDAVRARQVTLTTAAMTRTLGDYPDTDDICGAAVDALPEHELEALLVRLECITAYLVETGAVPGVWPSPHLVVAA